MRHKALIQATKQAKESFVSALDLGKSKFTEALAQNKNPQEQHNIRQILKEINARQNYEKACNNFTKIHNASHQIVFTSTNINEVISKLDNNQTELLKARADLYRESFALEYGELQKLFIYLAASWKEIGNTLFKNQERTKAIESYKKALDIYNLDDFSGKYILKELPIYSNLTITYFQSKLYFEAINTANSALLILDNCNLEERPIALQEKIVFNLIKSLCAQVEEFLSAGKTKDANALLAQAKTTVSSHENILSSQTRLSIEKLIGELQNRFQNIPKSHDDNSIRSLIENPLMDGYVNSNHSSNEVKIQPSPVNDSLTTYGIFNTKSMLFQLAREDIKQSIKLDNLDQDPAADKNLPTI